ncbi:MAG TPA: shikimate dehydrogenase [Candidatus Pelethocola excrementipullorum]|nr:shikimate dehydrogenase [Candidatus Pelethocola excrementipullorum]
MEKRIKGTTRLLGLIGSPVAHSGSPAMYNYCFEKLAYDYAYLAFDVSRENLPQMMETANLLNFRGMNVTMPLKQDVMKYMDVLTPAAKLIGACNTLVNEDGTWTGNNTDGVGYVRNLKDHDIEVRGKKMVILGAGGAGTAVSVQCALEGAGEISIFNPMDDFFEKAKTTAQNIKKEVPGCKIEVFDLMDSETLERKLAAADILANTTKVGMAPLVDESPIQDTSLFRKDLVVTDIIYNPRETRLLKLAKANGCKTIGGTGMLVMQGAEAFQLYTGDQMPVEEVKTRFFND